VPEPSTAAPLGNPELLRESLPQALTGSLIAAALSVRQRLHGDGCK
jgi:hypothetical protein